MEAGRPRETLLTKAEMADLLDATEANHAELRAGETPERQQILDENLAALRKAVKACAEMMDDLGLD